MFGYEFANPEYFWLLLVLIPMVIWYIFKEKRSHADLKFSSIRVFKQMKRGSRIWLRHLLFAARVLAILFLVLALARPHSSSSWQTYNSEGIDIMLALDISGSMLARDFTPQRLEAAKEVSSKVILERPQDRIGLVVFSGESFTQSPLTTDQAVLVNVMKDIHSGMIEDGTAIGLGLANAVNRLKDSKANSKVVFLLTDGVNNRGAIAPITAAELANAYGYGVYALGVGAIAAFNAVTRVDDFAFTPEQSIATAITTYIAQNRGAGQTARIRRGFAVGLRLELGYWLLMGSLTLLLRRGILSLFVAGVGAADVIALGST